MRGQTLEGQQLWEDGASSASSPELPGPTLPRRSKHGRGHVKRVRCESSAAMVPKDKAIKRFIVSGADGRPAGALSDVPQPRPPPPPAPAPHSCLLPSPHHTSPVSPTVSCVLLAPWN